MIVCVSVDAGGLGGVLRTVGVGLLGARLVDGRQVVQEGLAREGHHPLSPGDLDRHRRVAAHLEEDVATLTRDVAAGEQLDLAVDGLDPALAPHAGLRGPHPQEQPRRGAQRLDQAITGVVGLEEASELVDERPELADAQGDVVLGTALPEDDGLLPHARVDRRDADGETSRRNRRCLHGKTLSERSVRHRHPTGQPTMRKSVPHAPPC